MALKTEHCKKEAWSDISAAGHSISRDGYIAVCIAPIHKSEKLQSALSKCHCKQTHSIAIALLTLVNKK